MKFLASVIIVVTLFVVLWLSYTTLYSHQVKTGILPVTSNTDNNYYGRDYIQYVDSLKALEKKFDDSINVIKNKFNGTRDSLKKIGYNLSYYAGGKYANNYNYEKQIALNPYALNRSYTNYSLRYPSSGSSSRQRSGYTGTRGSYSSGGSGSSNYGKGSRSSYSSGNSRRSYSSGSKGSFRGSSGRSFRGGSRRGGK